MHIDNNALPRWFSGKESIRQCRRRKRLRFDPSVGWEDALEEENGNPLQYYCLKNSIHKRSLVATVHGLAKGQT